MSYAWDFGPVWRNIGILLDGMAGTARLTLAALALAFPLGLALALMRMGPFRIPSLVAVAYIEFFRAAPSLILIVWFYFAFPILFSVNLDAFAAALLAIGLQSSASIAEVFRGGIQSIDKGQWEAAQAVGLGSAGALRWVVLPQAVRNMIPVFLIRLAELIKATTLSAGIAFGETVYRANELASRTYRPIEVFTVTALLFFVLIFGLTQLSQYLHSRLAQR